MPEGQLLKNLRLNALATPSCSPDEFPVGESLSAGLFVVNDRWSSAAFRPEKP